MNEFDLHPDLKKAVQRAKLEHALYHRAPSRYSGIHLTRNKQRLTPEPINYPMPSDDDDYPGVEPLMTLMPLEDRPGKQLIDRELERRARELSRPPKLGWRKRLAVVYQLAYLAVLLPLGLAAIIAIILAMTGAAIILPFAWPH